jgi:hypothetical protein|tara:strand:- start:809 stop:1414 length:606 start_codon:yes stop_codon:yes gene_type:complete
MARARRKMRRQLMKKMRKGYLTPTERDELKDLDREVNQLNRRAARNIGLGGAAALYMAQQSGALDSLGDFLDERKDIREKRRADRATEKAEEIKTKDQQGAVAASEKFASQNMEDLMASLPKDPSDPSRRDKRKNMRAAEESAARALEMEQPEEEEIPMTFSLPSDYNLDEIQSSFVKQDAKGGYTPFLRAMRNRIRRKFR